LNDPHEEGLERSVVIEPELKKLVLYIRKLHTKLGVTAYCLPFGRYLAQGRANRKSGLVEKSAGGIQKVSVNQQYLR